MAPLVRGLWTLSLGLLAVGAVGAGTHGSWSGGTAPHAGQMSSVRAASAPSPGRSPDTTVAGPPAPSSLPAPSSIPAPSSPPAPTSTALGAGLITPSDLGGGLRVVPSAATDLLDSTPCLAGLQPSPAYAGRAVTALVGPNSQSLPTVVEDVASYAGGEGESVFEALKGTVEDCPNMALGFAGSSVTVQLARLAIPPVGTSDQAWSGSFSSGGSTINFQLGMVLEGPDVLTLVRLDGVPPSDPAAGSFASTLTVAVRKLA